MSRIERVRITSLKSSNIYYTDWDEISRAIRQQLKKARQQSTSDANNNLENSTPSETNE